VTALTAGVLFLVYVNAPAVAVRVHGAPLLVAAAVPMALALPVAHKILVRGEPVRLPGLLLAALAMLLLHGMSALASARPSASVDTLETWLLEGVVFAFLIANAIRTRSELQASVAAVVGAGAVMGALALAQQALGPETHTFSGFGQLDSAISDGSGSLRRRLAGPVGETNRFAQIMAVLIPIAYAGARTTRGHARTAYGVACALICGGMALAYSRGAIVALALAVPVALWMRLLRPRHVAAAALLAAGLLVAMPHYAVRVASIGEVAVQGLGLGGVGLRNADGAARGRLTEMKAAGLLFAEHPWLGAGPGLAPLYYERNAELVGGKVRAEGRRSHNLFLQLAAETGLLGLGAFAVVLLLAFRELERARRVLGRRDRRLWGTVCGLELALVISLTTSLFLHAAYIRYFWLLLGLSAAASAQSGPPALVALLARMLRETAGRIRQEA